MGKKTGSKYNFPSELIWDESMLAIKKSVEYISFEDFEKNLKEFLPQNSFETRERYAQVIIQRYFPGNSLNQLCSDVWKFYQDESLLQEVMRYRYLAVEALAGEFVEKYLSGFTAEVVPKDIFTKFSIDLYGTEKKKLFERLSATLKGLGFIQSLGKKEAYAILSFRLPKTAVFILIHYLFAKNPQTVMLQDILEEKFWQYLGIKSPEEVRNILKEANSQGHIAKYIVADQLEQITTKYTYQELLEKRITI